LPFFQILSLKLFVEFWMFGGWDSLRGTKNYVYRRRLLISSIYRVKRANIKCTPAHTSRPWPAASLGPLKIDKLSNAHRLKSFWLSLNLIQSTKNKNFTKFSGLPGYSHVVAPDDLSVGNRVTSVHIGCLPRRCLLHSCVNVTSVETCLFWKQTWNIINFLIFSCDLVGYLVWWDLWCSSKKKKKKKIKKKKIIFFFFFFTSNPKICLTLYVGHRLSFWLLFTIPLPPTRLPLFPLPASPHFIDMSVLYR